MPMGRASRVRLFLIGGVCLLASASPCSFCQAGRRALLPVLIASWPAHAEVRSDGFRYEALAPGTSGTEPRDGPAKKYAKIWLKFVGHINNFEGPVFDSSTLRGARKPAKKDYVEITSDLDDSFAPGMWEAVHRMKVGEKGRFIQPPSLSFGEGKMAIEGDEDSEVKLIPAGSTLYYEVELVRIVRP